MMQVNMTLSWIQIKILDLGFSGRPLERKWYGEEDLPLVPKYRCTELAEAMAARANRLFLLPMLTQDQIDPLTLKEMLEGIR